MYRVVQNGPSVKLKPRRSLARALIVFSFYCLELSILPMSNARGCSVQLRVSADSLSSPPLGPLPKWADLEEDKNRKTEARVQEKAPSGKKPDA